MDQAIVISSAFFSAATLCATFMSTRAAQKSAEAAEQQAKLALQSLNLHLGEAKERGKKEHDVRIADLMTLSSRIHKLWVLSTAIDNEVRSPSAETSDLSQIAGAAVFRNSFLKFMEESGPQLATLLGVDALEWEGMRYIEDMVRWCGERIPPKFMGQEAFYSKYRSMSQHLMSVKNAVIRLTIG